MPVDPALAKAKRLGFPAGLSASRQSPSPRRRRCGSDCFGWSQGFGGQSQVTCLPENGLNFVGLGLERLGDRAQQQAAGHAEFEVDELRDQAALHQVGDLGGFLGGDALVKLGQDLNHGVAAGDCVNAFEDFGQFAKRHVDLPAGSRWARTQWWTSRMSSKAW